MLADPLVHEIQYPELFPLPDIKELEKIEARESIRRYKYDNLNQEEKYSVKLFLDDKHCQAEILEKMIREVNIFKI